MTAEKLYSIVIIITGYVYIHILIKHNFEGKKYQNKKIIKLTVFLKAEDI